MSEKNLLDLGLTKEEIKVFMTLLEKPLSITEISIKTGLSNEQVEKTLESLSKKGFYSKSPGKTKQSFYSI